MPPPPTPAAKEDTAYFKLRKITERHCHLATLNILRVDKGLEWQVGKGPAWCRCVGVCHTLLNAAGCRRPCPSFYPASVSTSYSVCSEQKGKYVCVCA